MALVTYGREGWKTTGDDLVDQLSIECWAFRMGWTERDGALGKFGHFKNIVDLLWNNPRFESRKRFVWNSWAEWIFRRLCEHKLIAISGSSSSGKSDLIALWMVVNLVADPTHCKSLVMSTTKAAALQKIWARLMEYWDAIPNLPGKLVRQQHLIRGLNYAQTGYGDSSGIRLYASGEGMDSDALEDLIGIKAPLTQGGPDIREGSLLMAIDEMNGCSQVLLDAAIKNLKVNKNFQLIGIANFDGPWDAFGRLFEPKKGYENLKDDEYEFETKVGGIALILDAEQSPRIKENRIECTWMPSKQYIDEYAAIHGRNSPAFWRFIKGRPSPKGPEEAVYGSAEIIRSGAMGQTIWGGQKPVGCAFLDPARSGTGDLSLASFGRFGVSCRGVQTLQLDEQVPLQVDVTDAKTPVSYQLVKLFRAECEKRGIEPRNAGIDSTASDLLSIMHVEWSREILGIDSGGDPGPEPVSAVDRRPSNDVFANKATKIWYDPKPFFRSGQIRGMTEDLAKEMCSRHHATKKTTRDEGKLKIEDKREYRKRNKGKSPDKSDSFIGLVGLCKRRLGFRAIERAAAAPPPERKVPEGAMRMPQPGDFTRKEGFQMPSFKKPEPVTTGSRFGGGRRPALRVDKLRYD